MRSQNTNKKQGFTLIEVVLSIGILGIATGSLLVTLILGLKIIQDSKLRSVATSLANERIEQMRNLPYDLIGIAGGIPSGQLPATETINVQGVAYTIRYDVRYIDDILDGTAPADTVPTDYKKARIFVTWPSKIGSDPVIAITSIAPKGIETTSGGGTLRLQIFDSTPQAVPQANIQVINNLLQPSINISGQTDNNGDYLLPGAPASSSSYEIIVTKSGYSTTRTYAVDPQNNPNPDPGHLTVLEGEVTTKTFFIDPVATLRFTSTDDSQIETPWWDGNYAYRVPMTVQNNSQNILSTGYPLNITLDHATLVTANKALINSADFRISYWNGVSWNELDRITSTAWNTNTTKIWFASQNPIDPGSNDANYFLYYSQPSAINPPVNITKIFPPLVQNTVAWWGFEQPGSSVVSDSMSKIPDAAVINIDPLNDWVAGKLGIALKLSGTQCVRIPEDTDLDITGNLTIEGWIYPQNNAISQTLVDKNSPGSSGIFDIELIPETGNLKVAANVATNLEVVTLNSTTLLPLEAWHHIALTVDMTTQTASLFVNNVQEMSQVFTGTNLLTNDQDLFLGCNTENTNFFIGNIDGWGVHTEARTTFPGMATAEPTTNVGTEQVHPQGNPLGNITFTLHGNKTIGTTGEGAPIYKYLQTVTTDENGTLILNAMEPDTYTLDIDEGTTGYVIAQSNAPYPFILSPNANAHLRLALANASPQTLLLTIKSTTGPIISNADVQLTNSIGFDVTKNTNFSGQAFFGLLLPGNYTIQISHPSYQTETLNLLINGNIEQLVQLIPR